MESMDRYISKAASLAQEASKDLRRFTQDLVEKSKEVSVAGHFYDTSDDKIAEIRKDLDSKFDKEKIDGLKRLIAMISKGRNVSEFFPDVVKNVASNSFEVRKLVYIYLLRYAEQEPDLALLSINTFQKDLTDKNPLIRAMALRVMSSIRVPVIVPLIMLALKKCMTDLSPYVRKAAATAIPKCYSLDPSQKEYLVEIIEKLLGDNSTVVLGAVISSMNQVCPERLDLIHKHYRKLCRLLVDADEWGQLEMMGLLLRYARTQFLDPNVNDVLQKSVAPSSSRDFYSDDEEPSHRTKYSSNTLDPDHEAFLKACSSLLYSRNRSVVMTVAKVYFHLAPKSDWHRPAKALVRLLIRAPREEKYIVLLNILTMAGGVSPNQGKGHETGSRGINLFGPFLRHFYVFAGEPSFIRNLKLEILCEIADEGNVNLILREFRDYLRSQEQDFVVRTIQVMGRLSCKMPRIADDCLLMLMNLMSSKNEIIVAEAIVVIRHLLQLRSDTNTRMILKLSQALETITIAMARASILWLIGQYCEKLPRIAPDTLRISAKKFGSEEDIVKLQILNLAAKLVVAHAATTAAAANVTTATDPSSAGSQETSTDSKQAATPDQEKAARTYETLLKLFSYVLSLARYDVNYDIRDRARFLKALVYDKLAPVTAVPQVESTGTGEEEQKIQVQEEQQQQQVETLLSQHLKSILLGAKSMPLPENPYGGKKMLF
ncbi:AP-3 complex subunit beta-2 [Quaeritorhiza haematococci]|nr:AP-3 complex subunit beta-2 [Quaeritorhiza haematococci]